MNFALVMIAVVAQDPDLVTTQNLGLAVAAKKKTSLHLVDLDLVPATPAANQTVRIYLFLQITETVVITP